MRIYWVTAAALAVVACGGRLAPLGDAGDAGVDHEVEASFDAERDVYEAAIDRYVPPPPIITIAQSQNSPVAVVSDGTRVYWTNYGTGNSDGYLVSAPVGGGPQQRLVSGQNPWALAVSGGYAYWSSYGTGGANGSIGKVPIGGGAITTLAAAQTYPWAIAVDSTHVYWTQRIDMGATVNSAPIAYSGALPVPKALASFLLTPAGLALHNGVVYWTDYDPNGDIFSVPAAGGNYSHIAGLQDHPFAIVTDDNDVYWSTYEAIVSRPIAGGTPITVALAQQRIISLALDAKYVYWTDYYAGTVNEVPLGGGKVITLATGQDQAYGLAVDASRVYWTTFSMGNVVQMNKWP